MVHRKIIIQIFSTLILFIPIWVVAQGNERPGDFTVVRIKYDGGGDWYGNKTTFKNLFQAMSNDLKL